jgi:hypothetical protein
MVSRLRRTLYQQHRGFGFVLLTAILAASVMIGGCGGDEKVTPGGGDVLVATAANGELGGS